MSKFRIVLLIVMLIAGLGMTSIGVAQVVTIQNTLCIITPQSCECVECDGSEDPSHWFACCGASTVYHRMCMPPKPGTSRKCDEFVVDNACGPKVTGKCIDGSFQPVEETGYCDLQDCTDYLFEPGN